jgi:alkylation response protein AidB-like acyl-CoA dehydrogenase
MDFTLTEEQKMIRETAQTLFRKECSVDTVRKAWVDRAVGQQLWSKQLSGWVELADGDLTDIVLFMEEHGRALVPGPFFASLLARFVAQAAGLELEGTATVAVADKNGLWIPNHSQTKYFVPSAAECESIVWVSGSAQMPEVVLLSKEQLTLHEIENMDQLRPVYTATLTTAVMGKKISVAAWQQARLRAMVMTAAELVGVGRHLQESAVIYAKERQQFGKVIGAFQGLQWQLVDAALDLERAAAAVAYAAMCVDAGDPDAEKASLSAKAEAGLAARHCARTSLQVHGGIGYTWEQGLHYWLRRAYADDGFMGNHDYHFAELAEKVFS